MNDCLGINKKDLESLVNQTMPFGKYKGWALLDLPEEYLFWFAQAGREFPNGHLGELMKLCLELKIEGLDNLLKPLISGHSEEG